MQAGWYSDPTGNHEFRYHNGSDWTGDVATDGIRQVTPVPDLTAARAPRPSVRRSGTAAMILGIASMSFGWVPFAAFVTLFLGLAAVTIGLRRRRFESARGTATVGIVTGLFGVVLSAGGIWLSVVLLVAVSRFEDPGPHEVELTDCSEVGGATRATGAVTNLDEREHSYTVLIALDDDTTVEAVVDDVPAGERGEFQVDEDLRFADLDCSIEDVKGPRPFGISTT